MILDKEKIIRGIGETGYGLEFEISKILTSSRWIVINNKYYIDDVQGSSREIDILAYKASLVDGVRVYTVIIISCKKSKSNIWALLAKDRNDFDPNVDWKPVTLWSNNKTRKFMIDNCNWKDGYLASSGDLQEKLLVPAKHIFAFQEMNSTSGKPQNDKAIFDSVVTAMKSQEYEIGSLRERKKEEALYNFNLMSVVDGSLVRINYGQDNPSVEELDEDVYVGSYIINKKETISRVHFVRASDFEKCLSIYEDLHSHNTRQSKKINEDFYIECVKEKEKIALLMPEFQRLVKWDVYEALRNIGVSVSKYPVPLSLYWSTKNILMIEIEGVDDDNMIYKLNEDVKLQEKFGNTLERVYKYTGEFIFETEIPF